MKRCADLFYEYAGYQYYSYLVDRYNRLVYEYYQLQGENQRLRSENERLQTELQKIQQEKTLENTPASQSSANSTGIPSDIFQHQFEVIQQLREGGYLQKKRDKKPVQMCFAPITETDENTPE
jgi:cell division septum initiation protein DivIVA